MIKTWKKILEPLLETPKFRDIYNKFLSLYATKDIIPSKENIFKPFNLTDFDAIKVVIVGQDPYPNKDHATGLAFGVPKGSYLPSTLKNICDEVEASLIEEDKGEEKCRFLDRNDLTLEGWAEQGVLLLNSVLTTENGVIGAHQGLGWEELTDAIIYGIRQRGKPVVFMLWGKEAQKKMNKILVHGGIPSNVKILESTHPSPLSYNRGTYSMRFQGCFHFLEANKWLRSKGISPIDWSITQGGKI